MENLAKENDMFDVIEEANRAFRQLDHSQQQYIRKQLNVFMANMDYPRQEIFIPIPCGVTEMVSAVATPASTIPFNVGDRKATFSLVYRHGKPRYILTKIELPS